MLNRHHFRRGSAPGRHLQRGVGLIEVLIAVLVLSIGMLGAAGLQAWSLRNNMSALQRGMAVVHAYYIADVMRADRATAVNGGFDLAIDAAAPAGAAFAASSLAAWRTAIQDSLGTDATGSVDCNGPLCEVVVRWDDSRAQGGLAQQLLRIEVEL